MNKDIIFPVLALLVFGSFSVYVTITDGYTGFLPMLWSGGWDSQVFYDLCLALVMLFQVLRSDARKHGIRLRWYGLATPFLGSISPLVYFVHRGLKRRSGSTG